MAFWNVKPKEKEIDFLEDYYDLLLVAKETTSFINKIDDKKILSEKDIYDISIIYDIVNSYYTTTSYITSTLLDTNISFYTSKLIYKKLSTNVYDYFVMKRIPQKVIDRKEFGQSKVLRVILSDLYNIDCDIFLNKLKQYKTVDKAYLEYNKEILNISNDSDLLDIFKESYSFKELMNQEWFSNCVKSCLTIFVTENLNKDTKTIYNITELLTNHFKEQIAKSDIYTFLLALNNKDFLRDCYELTKASESNEFSKLNTYQQEEVLDSIIPKLTNHILMNMKKETEDLKNELIKDLDCLF